MKLARILFAATIPTVFGSAIVLAQDAAPKQTEVRAPRERSDRSPKDGANAIAGPFLVKPYLQLGHNPAAGKIVLMWHAADVDVLWTVERSHRRRSPLAGRGQGTIGSPRRGSNHRAAPRLSPRLDRTGAGQEVLLIGSARTIKSFSRPRPALPGRPTRSSGSSSSATAGPTRPSRRRSPTGPSCRSPTT